jgi:hypothetical protein
LVGPSAASCGLSFSARCADSTGVIVDTYSIDGYCIPQILPVWLSIARPLPVIFFLAMYGAAPAPLVRPSTCQLRR